jgi:hypothetical protein
VSQFPRRVLSDLTLMQGSWPWFVRAGTVVDVVPGSQLEAWYGPSNLSPVVLPACALRFAPIRSLDSGRGALNGRLN